MAGLLDFFQTPAGQGLLAAGLGAAASSGRGRGLVGNLGQGGLLGLQAYAGAQENGMRQQYQKALMDNIASEVETRKAALAKQQQIMSLLTGDGASAPTNYQPGQLGSGSFGAVAPAPGVPAIGAPAAGGAGNSRVGSLTPDRLAALKANGLDLVDVYKLTQPDMQVSNGYAYDKRAVQPGFLPQLNVAQNGQASMVRVGPDGLPVMSAPQGAVETYSSFRKADEAAKAGQDLVKIVGPDGAERYITRSQAVEASQPRAPAVSPQRAAVSMGAEADRFAILSQELAKAKAAGRSGDVAALEREIGRLPPEARTATNPSGLSVPGFQATPTTAQAAERVRLLKQTEADVQPTAQRKNDIAGSNYMLSVLDRAINHPGRETATGLSGTLDPRNYLPGTDATGFKAFVDQIRGGTFMQAYQNLKGGGQITEVEGKKAENAIARLNTAQSDDDFLSALTDLRSVIQSGLTRQMAGAQTGGATGSFAGDNSEMVSKPNLVQSLPKTATKGTRARDTATGRMLMFNGLQWVPEK